MRLETPTISEIPEAERLDIRYYEATVINHVYTVKSRKPAQVIITVPHDGLMAIDLPDLCPRRSGVIVRDLNVWPIVRDVLLHSSPPPVSIVRGLIPRTHVDYNRPEDEALEEQYFSKTYGEYHRQIESLLTSSYEQFGPRTLLIDLHGFTKQPDHLDLPEGGYDLILGTNNRQTVQHDADRQFGKFFIDRGYKVFVPGTVGKEGDKYPGGFTVSQYSNLANCLQVEIAPQYRNRPHGARLGPQLSNDLHEFISAISHQH